MFWPKISLAKRSTGEVLTTGACLTFTSVMTVCFGLSPATMVGVHAPFSKRFAKARTLPTCTVR
jgi:hypothetical protein